MDAPTTKVGLDGGIDQFTKNLIRKKAQQLIRKTGFTSSDRDEIEADLTFKLLKNLDAFDRSRAHWHVFVTTVIERCAASLVRDKRSQKRDHRRICSLNVVIAKMDKQSIELGDTIGLREQDARLGQTKRSDLDLVQLIQDVNAVLTSLPPELRTLAKTLKTGSIQEISRDEGIPRTTLNYRVQQLRQRFEQAGLGDYL